MKIIGIVTELNPLHNGHVHLFTQLRQEESLLICVMSGDFTQRGIPACCDKWSRAAMAIQNGADLVVALPFFHAVRSAYDFALGSIQILAALGIQYLGFGCETPHLALLQSIAALLRTEPPQYVAALKHSLQSGIGFATAREQALKACLPALVSTEPHLLHAPNTILALAYLTVLQTAFPSIQPLLIPRQGAGYHDEALSSLSSAQGIRHHLFAAPKAIESIQSAMPTSAYTLLQQEIAAGRCPVRLEAFGGLMIGLLRQKSAAELENLLDMREGLQHRIRAAAETCGTVESLVQAVSSKRYPKSRIQRLLLYALFGLTREKAALFRAFSVPPYAQLLAANGKGLRHLQKLRRSGQPLPTLLASGRELRSYLKTAPPAAAQMLQLDLLSSDVFSLGFPNPKERIAGRDFQQCGIEHRQPSGFD